MSKIASISLIVVGFGWMNNAITMTKSTDLVRPFENADEARDFCADARKQLAARPMLEITEGLLRRSIDFGDFSRIDDVRIVYQTESFAECPGLLGMSMEVTTTTREDIADFMNPDSYGLTAETEEEYA